MRWWTPYEHGAQQLDYRDMETIRRSIRCGPLSPMITTFCSRTGRNAADSPSDRPMRDQDLYRVELAEHQSQIQRLLITTPVARTQLVRDDPDDWVRKHYSICKSSKGFLSYF